MRATYELGAAVSLLTLLSLALADFHCPEMCLCAEEPAELRLVCEHPTGTMSVYADRGKYITLECNSGGVQCERLPRLHASGFESIQGFHIISCPLSNESLACVPRALGVLGIKVLTLRDIATQGNTLDRHHVAELGDLRELILHDLGELTVPHEAIAALPTLRRLTIGHSFLHLGSDAFLNSPPLEYLELSRDRIQLLPPGAFRGLSAVRDLSLLGNDIAQINEAAFEGLDSLELLDLSHNSIRLLSPGCFNAIPHLKEIRILYNPLEKITNATFTGLSMLETVILSGTGARELQIEERAFASLPALVTLWLSRSIVRQLAVNVFEASRAIRNLTLTHIDLQYIPDGLLRDQVELEFLDLSYNEIEVLNADIFAPLKRLRELNLDNNYITTLPESVFFGLARLKSISINNNRIENTSGNTFSGINEIEKISLANNSIAIPASELLMEALGPWSPFSWVPTLRFLDLSGNRIEQIILSDWLLLPVELDFLDLSRNSISELTNDQRYPSLSRNNITHILLRSSSEDIKRAVNDSHTARILLDNNLFICDCKLYGFVRLLSGDHRFSVGTILDPGSATCVSPAALSGRNVSGLPSASLSCLLPDSECPPNCRCVRRPETATLEMDCETEPSIDSFPMPAAYDLNNTFLRLRYPPSSLEALPPHVRKLNLSRIGLKEVPPEFALLNLEVCDLSHNKLTSIPFQLLNGTDELRISDNPIACDCSHAARVAEIQVHRSRVSDYNEVKCSNGDALWRVDSANLCGFKTIVTGLIVLLAVFVAMAAILVLIRKFDRKVKVFREELDRNKLYDVFISFSHRDTSIVQDELLPRLESAPYFYKACVHYRDWAAGDCIPVQIHRSVERSRRTMILLSRNFLESEWAAFELRAAYKQTLIDIDSRLIVVLLEDVADDPRLDEDLQAYIANNTYVKWGETWFWKKLVYALPRRHLSSKNKGQRRKRTVS